MRAGGRSACGRRTRTTCAGSPEARPCRRCRECEQAMRSSDPTRRGACAGGELILSDVDRPSALADRQSCESYGIMSVELGLRKKLALPCLRHDHGEQRCGEQNCATKK